MWCLSFLTFLTGKIYIFLSFEIGHSLMRKVILGPTAHDPFGQHQASRPLAGAGFLNMRRVLDLYFQPIRFVRFDNESVERGLSLLEPGLDP